MTWKGTNIKNQKRCGVEEKARYWELKTRRIAKEKWDREEEERRGWTKEKTKGRTSTKIQIRCRSKEITIILA